jgi:hypothetical protein
MDRPGGFFYPHNSLQKSPRPFLVDLEQNSPHLSIAQIEANISDSTVAIIAVNFLGIPEQVTQIRQVCDEHGLEPGQGSAWCYFLPMCRHKGRNHLGLVTQ